MQQSTLAAQVRTSRPGHPAALLLSLLSRCSPRTGPPGALELTATM
jgi:hypothetical protein